jgi:V/A-type H+-transporting ATPase subunit E
LKEQLQHEFRGWVGRLVQDQLPDQNFVAEVIREMAGQAIAAISDGPDTQDSQRPVRLRFLVGGGESKPLEDFVRSEAAEMLRQGVCLQADRSLTHGFRVQLVDQNLELDFTEKAITAALMRFLAPKFRQLIGSASGEAESA